jgi:hypothetical protein
MEGVADEEEDRLEDADAAPAAGHGARESIVSAQVCARGIDIIYRIDRLVKA